MLDLLFDEAILGNVCIVTTVVLILSGSSVVSVIRNRRSSKGISILPLLTCAVSCTVWTKYALIKEDKVLMITNGFGMVLEWFYVLIFVIYTPDDTKSQQSLFTHFSIQVSFLITILYMSSRTHPSIESFENMMKFLANTCVFTNIANYFSSISSVYTVLKDRQTGSLNFYLSLAYFIQTVAWLQYGLITQKIVVLIPNALGIFVTGFTLMLFTQFPKERNLKLPDYHQA